MIMTYIFNFYSPLKNNIIYKYIMDESICKCIDFLPTNKHIPKNAFCGKKILIVGGTSGMGYEAGIMFSNLGASVVMTTRHKKCNNTIHGIKLIELDITSIDSIKQVVKKIKCVDILIANGGIFTGGRATDFSDVEMMKAFYAGGAGHINLIKEYLHQHPTHPTIICANIGDWVLKQPDCTTTPIDVNIGRLYYIMGKTCLYKFIVGFNAESKQKYPNVIVGFIATENAKTNFAKNSEYVNKCSHFTKKIKDEQEKIVENGMDPSIAGMAYVEYCYNHIQGNGKIGYYVKNPNNYLSQD